MKKLFSRTTGRTKTNPLTFPDNQGFESDCLKVHVLVKS